MKASITVLTIVSAILTVVGCGSGPQSMIVGKWEAGQPGSSITTEFTKDGQTKITMLGNTLQGTYKMTADDEMECTQAGITTKYKVKVTSTELTLTSDGNTVTYKKI